MVSAMEEAERGMPVKRAARLFGVPRSTLRDRVAGNVQHGTNPRPVPYLTNAEEAELAGFLVDVAKAGYGKSRRDIKWIAENVAREKNVLKHTLLALPHHTAPLTLDHSPLLALPHHPAPLVLDH